MFQISLPWLHLFFYNACPHYLKSRRDLLYLVTLPKKSRQQSICVSICVYLSFLFFVVKSRQLSHFQALSFQVPHLFWLKRASGSGLNLPAIMEGASRLTVVESKPDKRVKLINEIGNILNAYFRRNVEGQLHQRA